MTPREIEKLWKKVKKIFLKEMAFLPQGLAHGTEWIDKLTGKELKQYDKDLKDWLKVEQGEHEKEITQH